MMMYSNVWATAIMTTACVWIGHVQPTLAFCRAHPVALVDLMLLCVSSALGQVGIFYLVGNFSALACRCAELWTALELAEPLTTTRPFPPPRPPPVPAAERVQPGDNNPQVCDDSCVDYLLRTRTDHATMGGHHRCVQRPRRRHLLCAKAVGGRFPVDLEE